MKKVFLIILSLVFMLSFSSCAQNKEQSYSKDFLDLFDTASSITAQDTSQQAFNTHFDAVYSELQKYSQLYDIYNSYGDMVNLKYINENAAKAPVKVDEKIIDLLLWGKKAYEISGGRVNIAMGSVLSEWHDARDYASENPENAYLPDMDVLKEKAQHTDINDLIIDEQNSTVYFKDPEMSIDAGAVAKGYIADKISEFITENNIWQSAIINLGGNVKTLGFKNGISDTSFNIGIENPQGGYIAVVSAANGKSVVTSGDYQRYYTVNGKRYCHIISPETLMPAQGIQSVSVVSDNSALADVLSTTMFQMSPQDAVEFLKSFDGCEAVIMDSSGELYYSDGFKDLMQ